MRCLPFCHGTRKIRGGLFCCNARDARDDELLLCRLLRGLVPGSLLLASRRLLSLGLHPSLLALALVCAAFPAVAHLLRTKKPTGSGKWRVAGCGLDSVFCGKKNIHTRQTRRLAFGKWGGAPLRNQQRTGRAVGNFVSVTNLKLLECSTINADRLLGATLHVDRGGLGSQDVPIFPVYCRAWIRHGGEVRAREYRAIGSATSPHRSLAIAIWCDDHHSCALFADQPPSSPVIKLR